jgi:hypothetical protein
MHPGEVVSSFVMEGFLRQLLESRVGEALREHYDCWVVPMLNMDGVILGNYRCSLAGADLNRRWSKPSKKYHPEVYFLKKMILKHESKVELIIDLHSHSKASDIFAYALSDLVSPQANRIFPAILDELSPAFNLNKCSFDRGRGKGGTARVTLGRAIPSRNVFTIECSFMGETASPYHFSRRDLLAFGGMAAQAIDLKRTLAAWDKRDLLFIKIEKCPFNEKVESSES